jgi:AhpD family alkylhydroperoxidase
MRPSGREDISPAHERSCAITVFPYPQLSKISPSVREQVIVRVGAVADCEYQLVQHKTEALRTGTSPELH